MSLLLPRAAQAGTYAPVTPSNPASVYSGGTFTVNGTSTAYAFSSASNGGGTYGGSRLTLFQPASIQCGGAITATWHWIPANANDQPPQSVMIVQTSSVSATSGDSYSYGGSATCADGLGGTFVPYNPIYPNAGGSAQSTKYSIIPGGWTVSAPACAPTASATDTNFFATNWVSVSYSAQIYPAPTITISSPNPLGRPDMGDGTNQYVYSADTPDGYLYVPGALQVSGASTNTGWLINNSPIVTSSDIIDMRIEGNGTNTSTIPNTFTHQWAVSGSTIYVNTPQDVNNPYPGYQFNKWIFKGLPASFSTVADGNHDVNLYVQGTKAQTAKIQTFYQATVSNYPQAAMDYAVYNYYLPNWYNYFEQAFPNSTTYDPNLVDLLGNSHPNFAAFAQCGGSWDTSVTPNRHIVEASIQKMGPGALTTPATRGIPVFEISPYTNFLDYIGQMQVQGIYSYLYVDAHEAEHNALQVSNECYIPDPNSIPPAPPVDTDGDWMTDIAEAKYYLNPNIADTTGYYTDANRFPEGTYGDGDTEAVCDIAGLHAVLSNPNAWQHDWSNAGVQYGARPAYFPYQYVPNNINLPLSVSPPATAVTALPQ